MGLSSDQLIELLGALSAKDYNFSSPSGSMGIFYAGGYYDSVASATVLDETSPSNVFGTANAGYGAHAFIVAGGAGVSNKTTGSVELVVQGTSMNDQGNRTPGDEEVLIADVEAESLNKYTETTNKWIGQITYLLRNNGTGDATTFSLTFNNGLTKYEDIFNKDFKITGFEVVGLAGANDSGFDIRLLHHKATGWTYDNGAFVPGSTALAQWTSDYNTEINLVNGEQFAYKRDDLSQIINGDNGEGYIIEITTGANNAVKSMDIHVKVEPN